MNQMSCQETNLKLLIDTGFEQEGQIMQILPIIVIGWCSIVDF